jgi:hypothetical protein
MSRNVDGQSLHVTNMKLLIIIKNLVEGAFIFCCRYAVPLSEHLLDLGNTLPDPNEWFVYPLYLAQPFLNIRSRSHVTRVSMGLEDYVYSVTFSLTSESNWSAFDVEMVPVVGL